MEQQQPEPQAPAPLPSIRHDGWTGERMATFCEALAETAVVAEACDAAGMGISGAYAARRRSPVFSAAWDAALSIARERLADTLLARSMEGNVEQIYRNGELVGERHFLDNRLGLAILRRLDRLAEQELARDTPPAQRTPAARPINWTFAVDALRAGDDDGVARALALLKANPLNRSTASEVEEVEEVEGQANPPLPTEQVRYIDRYDRCWFDRREKCWMTDFAPPAGFDGYESRDYDEIENEEPYERNCTEEEAAILEADRAADRAAERAEDGALRDEWFALLRGDFDQDEDEEEDEEDGGEDKDDATAEQT